MTHGRRPSFAIRVGAEAEERLLAFAEHVRDNGFEHGRPYGAAAQLPLAHPPRRRRHRHRSAAWRSAAPCRRGCRPSPRAAVRRARRRRAACKASRAGKTTSARGRSRARCAGEEDRRHGRQPQGHRQPAEAVRRLPPGVASPSLRARAQGRRTRRRATHRVRRVDRRRARGIAARAPSSAAPRGCGRSRCHRPTRLPLHRRGRPDGIGPGAGRGARRAEPGAAGRSAAARAAHAGAHPDGADVAALVHLLGPAPRCATTRACSSTGRIGCTRRSAPSRPSVYYEGRLLSSPPDSSGSGSTATQFAGSGLFLVEVAHEGNQAQAQRGGRRRRRHRAARCAAQHVDERGRPTRSR